MIFGNRFLMETNPLENAFKTPLSIFYYEFHIKKRKTGYSSRFSLWKDFQ